MNACPNCSSTDLIGFGLAPKGEPLQFRHCRSCEHHWWSESEQEGEVALDAVLEHIGA